MPSQEQKAWVDDRMKQKGYSRWSSEAKYGARRALIDLAEDADIKT